MAWHSAPRARNGFKSAVGADVGDIITSMIATVAQAGLNCFEYFNVTQQYAAEVKAQPERWLLWNYEQAMLEEEVTVNA